MLDFERINWEQVQEVLENHDTNKATVYDAIPIKMMKIGAAELAHPLSTLFNSFTEKGKWPAEWKKDQRTPAFKRGDRCAITYVKSSRYEYDPLRTHGGV